jgi:hypothetical protein
MKAHLVGTLQGIARVGGQQAADAAFTEQGGYDDYNGSRWHTSEPVDVPDDSTLVRTSPTPGFWRDAVLVK